MSINEYSMVVTDVTVSEEGKKSVKGMVKEIALWYRNGSREQLVLLEPVEEQVAKGMVEEIFACWGCPAPKRRATAVLRPRLPAAVLHLALRPRDRRCLCIDPYREVDEEMAAIFEKVNERFRGRYACGESDPGILPIYPPLDNTAQLRHWLNTSAALHFRFVDFFYSRTYDLFCCKFLSGYLLMWRYYPRGVASSCSNFVADEAAFRLALPGDIATKYHYVQKPSAPCESAGMTTREKYDVYILNCSLLSDAQKFWIKEALFYEKDMTRQFRGLKKLLCDFSGKNLRFQSKHTGMCNYDFNQQKDRDYDLWPAIDVEAQALLKVIHESKAACDTIENPRVHKPTNALLMYIIGKLTSGIQALEQRHPKDLSSLNLEIAAQSMNPVIQEELDPDNCVTQ